MTEKNYNPQQKEMMAMRKQERVVKPEKPKHEEKVIEKALEKTEEKNMEEKKEEKKEEKAEEKKIEEKKKERPKKTKVFVNATDVPISVKHSAAICYFIKRKKISDAIRELEQVAKKKNTSSNERGDPAQERGHNVRQISAKSCKAFHCTIEKPFLKLYIPWN